MTHTLTSSTLRAASWDEIRDLFAATPGTIHLNTGTVGVMPHAVLEEYDRMTREWTGGLADIYRPTMFTEHRTAIGRSYGADVDEIVITHNTTEAVARIINGLELGSDDEAIATTHECYSVLSNFNLVRNRFGLSLKVLTPPSGYHVSAEEIVALFEDAITPRTKVLAFSAVSLWTGTLMPVRAICELAHRHGLITVIDGALISGMLNVNLRESGADFIACSGSKYQCGPLGSGILYIRNKVLPDCSPLPLPTLWPIISTWYPMIGDTPPRSATSVESYNIADYLQSAGSANIARGGALAKACTMWDEIGRDRIESRVMELGDHARERVLERFGENSMYSPCSDKRLRSPLVAFNPFREAADAWNVKKITALTDILAAEHRIWIRWTEFDVPDSPHQHYAARICTHIFNDYDQIDRAVTTIATVAEKL
ncbi:aminotransferase class V-fold PLP-dependent enzyme [Mycobacterium sp.]|uniref:aminotransferase class V-fold PLP-dependent enzyme n=1 Tax=Mycobacterium sp. TaxID=1785 RepID=UPI002B5AA204|nr:aminotransferase class V-fold PLP-dependent enzyme [Mycobacterium sp.]HTY35353.1 aminotransferase class V-fold PLP-dependent enzyme [Mycobacterium sp.]